MNLFSNKNVPYFDYFLKITETQRGEEDEI
jgi:hypothetical protein